MKDKMVHFVQKILVSTSLLLLPLSLQGFEDDWTPTLDLAAEDADLNLNFDQDIDQGMRDAELFFEELNHEPKLFNLDEPFIAPPKDNLTPEAPIESPTQVLTPTPIPAAPIIPISTPEPLPQAPEENKGILINFNNVSIVEFIRFISRASNKNFIYDEADLAFNVSIVSEEPTSLPNILTALMQVLRVHGLSLIEQGNNIVIHHNKAISQVSQVVADGLPAAKPPIDSELVTRVFRLNTLDAEKAAVIVTPLVSDGALVEVLKDTSHIIVTDVTTNVEKIGQLLKSLDAPNSGLSMGQYVVVNALLDSLISLAEKVMTPIAEGKPLVFVAHAPSNSVFVVSTPFIVERSLGVLKTLDINVGETRIFTPESLMFNGTSQKPQRRGGAPGEPGSEGEEGYNGPGSDLSSPWSQDLPSGHIERTKFFIHKLRYRKGEQIVDALGRVAMSLQETGSGNIDLISSIQSIQWLEASNSLVFTGTIASIGKVRELIDEIDTPLRQVFIEMLILETDLDDSLTYGVNFGARFSENSLSGSESFLSGANTLSATLDNALPSASLTAKDLAREAGYHLGLIGRNVTHCGMNFSTIGALVKAVHDKGKTEILMNPKLLVEDNSPAEIFVGINTQFKTQSITNDQGNIITNNFEFRDVGTRMKITPLISNNDMVTLDIQEEVSSVVNTSGSAGTLDTQNIGPTTRINRTTTKVHIPNKFFLIMSGMIHDEETRVRSQVPCLGGAPLLGGLFSEKRLNTQKRNLMIFVRPQIIDTEQDIDDITRHQQDAYRDHNRSKKMWKYEVEEALDLLNVKEPDVSLHDSEEFNP